MINTDGAIICGSKDYEKLFMQRNKRGVFICLPMAAVFITAIVLVAIFGKYIDGPTFIYIAIYGGFGTVSFILILLSVSMIFGAKNFKRIQGVYRYEYEFYQDYLVADMYENGSRISACKVKYNELICYEVKDFFLGYFNIRECYPISKDGLTSQELNAIRKLLKLRILQGYGMAEIAKCKPATADVSAEASVTAAESAEATFNPSDDNETSEDNSTADKNITSAQSGQNGDLKGE